MGREIKRVPLDFDWPLNEVWSGFLSPDSLDGIPCTHCNGGETWASRWLYLLCNRINMLGDDLLDQQRGRPMHPWLAEDPYPADRRPSADIADLLAGIDSTKRGPGLTGWNTGYELYKTLVKASGVENWGSCKECDGHGETERYEGQRAEREAWEASEPPSGEGWQLWETVSEGSPISPVFADAEALAQWLTTRDACWGAMKDPMTIEQARGFVGAGWAPSMIGNAGGIHDGATFIGTEAALGGDLA